MSSTHQANRYDVLLATRDRVDSAPAMGLRDLDRSPAPWESRMQATCECLSWRGSLPNTARRHAEDELGETLYAEFPVHTRPALVAAHALLDRGVITPEELQEKMKEVRERLERA